MFASQKERAGLLVLPTRSVFGKPPGRISRDHDRNVGSVRQSQGYEDQPTVIQVAVVSQSQNSCPLQHTVYVHAGGQAGGAVFIDRDIPSGVLLCSAPRNATRLASREVSRRVRTEMADRRCRYGTVRGIERSGVGVSPVSG